MSFIKFLKPYFSLAESKNTSLYFLSSVFSALIGLVTLPIYTNFLSPAEFGIWGILIAFNNFLLPLFQLGLNSFYLKEHYNNELSDKSLFSSLFFFTLLWSFIFIGISVVVGPFIFSMTNIKVNFFPYMLLILTSNISVSCFTFLPLKFRIEGKALKYSIVLIVKTLLITFISLILVVLYEQSIMGRIYGFALGNALFILFCVPFLKKYLTFKLDVAIIQRGIKTCLPLVPAVLATLLFDTFDRLMLGKYRSLDEVGYYNIAAQLAAMVTMAYMSFYKAIEPKIFKWSNAQDYESLRKLFSTIIILLGTISAITILLIEPAMKLLVSPSFFGAIPIAKWLVLVVFMQGTYLLMATYNVSLHRNKYVMIIALCGLCVFLFSMYFLAPTYGANGVAIAKSLSFVLMTVVMWLSIDKPAKFLKVVALALLSYFCLSALIVIS